MGSSGILLCILLDVLLALGKNTVKKEEDFKRLFHAKSLGIMPRAKFHKKRTQTQELIVLDNPRIPRSFLEAARTVRRRIERAQKETGMKSFLVTSAMPGEGKSTVSANIAISLAMKGYKVILVDADLRNPSTAKVLGMNEQELGTLEVMKGEVNIDDAVQQYKNTSVKVLAGSTPIQDTSTVLSGKNMRQFVKELEAEADFVIIDTPPSGLLSDAAIVAQYVDGAVFSCQVKQIKPEPDIYQTLIKRYNLDPQKSVFLDDRKENCEAARKQGIHAIQFESFKQAAAELEKLGVK